MAFKNSLAKVYIFEYSELLPKCFKDFLINSGFFGLELSLAKSLLFFNLLIKCSAKGNSFLLLKSTTKIEPNILTMSHIS